VGTTGTVNRLGQGITSMESLGPDVAGPLEVIHLGGSERLFGGDTLP
jgi:hypothetical protein